MATPESRTLRMIANRSLTSLASSEEVGSSRISTLALITIARAMATSCCIAMEMELSGVCGSMDSRPICAKYFLAASWVFFQSMPKGPRFSWPSITFSPTERLVHRFTS